MSDEPTANPAPTEAPTSNPTAAEPTFSRAEVEAILAAERGAAPAADADPVAKWRAITGATAKKPPAPQSAPTSEMGDLMSLMKAQIMGQLAASMPRPPAPAKPLGTLEKLADRDAMLGRGPNAWSPSDRAAHVADHARKLVASGFQGHVDQEAERRASAERYHARLAAFGGPTARVVVDQHTIIIPTPWDRRG